VSSHDGPLPPQGVPVKTILIIVVVVLIVLFLLKFLRKR
jgi:hypothetical protein